MQSLFKAWKTSRKLHANFFEQYNLSQLNHIPEGFSNNLIWNIGHVIVAQQSLVYKGSNLEGHIPGRLYDLYNPGTRPTGNTTQSEADELKELLTSMIELTIADFDNGIFQEFNERTTGTGFHLASVTDAFHFNNYHEGLHLGYMMSIRKFL